MAAEETGPTPEVLGQAAEEAGPGDSAEQRSAPEPAADGAFDELADHEDEIERDAPDIGWGNASEAQRQAQQTDRRLFGGDQLSTKIRGLVRNSGKTSFGPNSIVADVVNLPVQESTATIGRLPEDALVELVDSYCRIPEFDEAQQALLQSKVLYLAGAAGSGRSTTAFVLATMTCGQSNVSMIDLLPDAELTSIWNKEIQPEEANCYVIELAGLTRPRESALAVVTERIRSAGAFAVLVGSLAQRSESPSLRVVRHSRPDPEGVLTAQLKTMLTHDPGKVGDIDLYVTQCLKDENVQEELKLAPEPGRVAQLAVPLAEEGRKANSPADGLKRIGRRQHEFAAEIIATAGKVNADNDSTDDDTTTVSTRQQAARIAYALCEGQPLSDIYRVAQWLWDRLDPPKSAEDGDLHRPRFDINFASLLHEGMVGQSPEQADERTAWLVTPTLAGSILDVVWNDYDSFRRPMLLWLNDIIMHEPKAQVRQRAAHIAGRLATYDFEAVTNDLIRPWAKSARATARQAAAWAVNFAALDEATRRKVRGRLRSWSDSSDEYLQDTTARVYAASLGTLPIQDALRNLTAVAMKTGQVSRNAVAQAISSLFRPENGSEIVDLLHQWIEVARPGLRVQAARALVYLAHYTIAASDGQWPALLELSRNDEKTFDQLVTLWRTALTEGTTALRAWAMLLDWLAYADRIDDAAPTAERLVRQIIGQDQLRLRARFHFTIWLRQDPGLRVVRRLHSDEKGQ
jgi:hypothetical protein